MRPTTTMTVYSSYPTTLRVDDYWKKLTAGFRAVNIRNDFSIYRTRSHLHIKCKEIIIFIIENTAHSVRNLYLELHSCNYDVTDWYTRRNRGEFDSETYRSEGITPPNASLPRSQR